MGAESGAAFPRSGTGTYLWTLPRLILLTNLKGRNVTIITYQMKKLKLRGVK